MFARVNARAVGLTDSKAVNPDASHDLISAKPTRYNYFSFKRKKNAFFDILKLKL